MAKPRLEAQRSPKEGVSQGTMRVLLPCDGWEGTGGAETLARCREPLPCSQTSRESWSQTCLLLQSSFLEGLGSIPDPSLHRQELGLTPCAQHPKTLSHIPSFSPFSPHFHHFPAFFHTKPKLSPGSRGINTQGQQIPLATEPFIPWAALICTNLLRFTPVYPAALFIQGLDPAPVSGHIKSKGNPFISCC